MLKSRVRIPKNVVASNNTHPTVEAAAEKDHPRELVAQIAATLQKPDEPEAVSVERALKLLDATAEALGARAKARDQQRTVPEWLSFNDGLKWLTKQRRVDRARKEMHRLLAERDFGEEWIQEIFNRHADKVAPRDMPKDLVKSGKAFGYLGGFLRHELIYYAGVLSGEQPPNMSH